MSIIPIKKAIEDIKQGKMLIVVDDENRENEGDIIVASQKISAGIINFMITHCKGLVCVPLEKERLLELDLPQMTNKNEEKHTTKFSISVDAKEVTTGISAKERALTIEYLCDKNKGKNDFRKPGHIFPLQAEKGGVLRRAGHTEAAVDLAKLAQLHPSGVICEIIKENGEMARFPDLEDFSKKHKIGIIKIADLIAYRLQNETIVKRRSEAMIPTIYGDLKVIAYKSYTDNYTHIALVYGDIVKKKNVLVRMHSECFTGDVLGSLKCDCGDQLHTSFEMICKEGAGVVVYLRQEGRGIGFENKLKVYKLQEEKGLDTVEANKHLGYKTDLRDYGVGASILKDLGLSTLSILTNNPKKIIGLEGYGLTIKKRIPIIMQSTRYNENYLKTKKEKMGHLL